MESIKASASKNLQTIVVPGDYIDEGLGLTAGHGTYELKDEEDPSQGSKIYASVAGVVHYIDQYVCVKALKQGYRPDIGDVVVGRIVSIQNKAWHVDINAYQHAVLALTNINLPGGEQRRRNEEDQQDMRKYFREGDIISAEVQQIGSGDGKITIQTRNLKYGKLVNGFLMKVDSNFIRRGKNHIHNLSEYAGLWGVSLILGTNGYLWLQPAEELTKSKETSEVKPVSAELRGRMATLRNAIVALEKQQIPIFKDTIISTVDQCGKMGLQPKDILKNSDRVTKNARDSIQREINLQRPQQNVLSLEGFGAGSSSDFYMKQ